MPSSPSSSTAVSTTKFRYYVAGTHTDPTCANRPGWAGLLCKTYPAAQPNTPGQPALLVTAYSNYTPWGQAAKVSASPADSGENSQTTTTTFDASGRPTSVAFGGGGTAVPTTETLYSSTSTFTASYDADGSMVEQTLPNGLVAETDYDETGAPVHLAYEKTTGCLTACTWLEFDVAESIHGQWLEQTSTLSS